jgi:hypothetical protein
LAKNKLNDLRDHLFETFEAVKDGSMDIDRAKIITQLASTIIDTARVEIKFWRASAASMRPAASSLDRSSAQSNSQRRTNAANMEANPVGPASLLAEAVLEGNTSLRALAKPIQI